MDWFSTLLGFLGSYWWLVFPLGGVIAGGSRGLSKMRRERSELRHRQKMERIALERHGVIPSATEAIQQTPMTPPSAIPAAPSALSMLLADHDEMTARWLDYELDVAKLIAFPAMSDGRQPLTADFLRAKRVADSLRPAPDAVPTREQLTDYRNAVNDYGLKFDLAERDARRVRDSGFTDQERTRLDRAQQLLRTAVDQSATAAERQLAYKRVRTELDGLIVVSDDAIEVLEAKVAAPLSAPIPPAKEQS